MQIDRYSSASLKTYEVCARNKTATILKRHVKEKKIKGENEQFSNGLVDDKNGTIQRQNQFVKYRRIRLLEFREPVY